MSQAELTKLAMAGAVLFAAYKFGPAAVKAAALSIGAIVVAKRIPYVQDVI